MNRKIFRALDILISALSSVVWLPIFGIIFLLLLAETSRPLYIQQRVGRNGCTFRILKFRTMREDVPVIATHLVDSIYITTIGKFLRSSKLDEIPQLINVLIGDMSLVGPRPSLPSLTSVVKEREKLGVLRVRPGITGLSQLRGVDMSTPVILAETDAMMITRFTTKAYFYYLISTLTARWQRPRSL